MNVGTWIGSIWLRIASGCPERHCRNTGSIVLPQGVASGFCDECIPGSAAGSRSPSQSAAKAVSARRGARRRRALNCSGCCWSATSVSSLLARFGAPPRGSASAPGHRPGRDGDLASSFVQMAMTGRAQGHQVIWIVLATVRSWLDVMYF